MRTPVTIETPDPGTPEPPGNEAVGPAPRALLVCEPGGCVVGMNPAAERLLGQCVGRPCWDAVGGLDDERRPICQPGCTGRLQKADEHRVDRNAHVRGAQRRVVCTCVGDIVVVQLDGPVEGAAPVAQLSRRERDVLTLASQGLTTPLIADRLGIGVATVRSHVANALRKLGAKSQAQAVGLALRSGQIR